MGALTPEDRAWIDEQVAAAPPLSGKQRDALQLIIWGAPAAPLPESGKEAA